MNERTKSRELQQLYNKNRSLCDRTKEPKKHIFRFVCECVMFGVCVLRCVRLGHFYYLHVINAKKTD